MVWTQSLRNRLHIRARNGFGGVGFLIKQKLLEIYEIIALDNDVDGVLWLHLKAKLPGDETILICVCYLPPDGSTRTTDPGEFFDHLITQLYLHQHLGKVVVILIVVVVHRGTMWRELTLNQRDM